MYCDLYLLKKFHFIDEETENQRVSNLPKVTQLVNTEPEFEPWNSDLRADTITLYSSLLHCSKASLLKKKILFMRERERERERERNKHWFVVHWVMHSLVAPWMCPDWGWGPQRWCVGTVLWPTELPGQGQFPFEISTVLLEDSALLCLSWGPRFCLKEQKERMMRKLTKRKRNWR